MNQLNREERERGWTEEEEDAEEEERRRGTQAGPGRKRKERGPQRGWGRMFQTGEKVADGE